MSDYLTALETELKHVEQVLAAAADDVAAELKTRIKDIKAEIKAAGGSAAKVAADVNKVEKAVAPVVNEVATATKA